MKSIYLKAIQDPSYLSSLGGFDQKLYAAFGHASMINQQRLAIAFPSDFSHIKSELLFKIEQLFNNNDVVRIDANDINTDDTVLINEIGDDIRQIAEMFFKTHLESVIFVDDIEVKRIEVEYKDLSIYKLKEILNILSTY